jgi:hypothetical protein
MKRFTLGFLLLMPFLLLGCGSSASSPPPMNDEANAAIEANDANVDAAESAQ